MASDPLVEPIEHGEHQELAGIRIDPGHDSWVPGDEPAVLIEFDFGTETVERLGIPASHRHD